MYIPRITINGGDKCFICGIETGSSDHNLIVKKVWCVHRALGRIFLNLDRDPLLVTMSLRNLILQKPFECLRIVGFEVILREVKVVAAPIEWRPDKGILEPVIHVFDAKFSKSEAKLVGLRIVRFSGNGKAIEEVVKLIREDVLLWRGRHGVQATGNVAVWPIGLS